MSLVRTMYALMASRKPVLLSDGRKGVITRVDTSFPEAETTLHVWTNTTEGPGLAKVDAKTVTEIADDSKRRYPKTNIDDRQPTTKQQSIVGDPRVRSQLLS